MAERAWGSISAAARAGSARFLGGKRGLLSCSAVALVVVAVCVCGASARPALLPGLVSLAAVTPSLVAADIAEHRLPNRLVGLSAAAVFAAWLVHVLVSGAVDLASPAIAAGTGTLLLLLAVGGGLGMGDVKLGAVLAWNAALIDPSFAALCGVTACVAGGIHSVVVLARTRDATLRIPFGPALLGGFWGPVLLLAATGSATSS